jgi:hypothetical protein
MDDLTIAWRPLGGLIPYARNPRNHSDAQVAQIAGSIKEFGWTNPVLVDGANGIVAGHGRVLAARKLGLDRVPVIELAHMSEAQKRAYILADNQLAANAGWDEELLRLELADLSELGGGRGATSAVRRDPAPDRPAARAARAGDVTGDNETMATAEGRTMRRSAVGPAATRCRGGSKRFACLPTLRIAASGAHPVDRHLSREHRRCRDGSHLGNLG